VQTCKVAAKREERRKNQGGKKKDERSRRKDERSRMKEEGERIKVSSNFLDLKKKAG